MQQPAYATSRPLVSWALPRVIAYGRLKIDNAVGSLSLGGWCAGVSVDIPGLVIFGVPRREGRRSSGSSEEAHARSEARMRPPCATSPSEFRLTGRRYIAEATRDMQRPFRSSSSHQLKTTASTNSNTTIATATSYHGGRLL